MDWDTIDFTPGDHRVAINLELQGGDTFWWYQQPSRIYHVLAGSGAAASRPAITDLRYAPEEATAGQPVSVEVDATGGGTDLSSVQLAVNTAADGSTSADWVYVGTVAVTGNSATARFSWDTTGLAPGSHAVAINLVLADGRTVYWYQQPTREYQLN